MKSASKYRTDATDSLSFKYGLNVYHDMSNTQKLRVMPHVDILNELNKQLWK